MIATRDGVPYLRPEGVLLYKAKAARDAFRDAAEASGEPAEKRLQDALARLTLRQSELKTYLATGQWPAEQPSGKRPIDKIGPEYQNARRELDRLELTLKSSRLNGARAARAASMISATSPAFSAGGFSEKTCFPASRH